MTGRPEESDEALWNGLVASHASFITAGREFARWRSEVLQRAENPVRLVRDGLAKPTERSVAIEIARVLPKEQLKQLFPELVSLASFSHGLIGGARDLILSLPRDWTLTNIESVAEPILAQGGYEEFQRLIELYVALSPVLARRLAQRAIEHPDIDVVEVGRDCLDRISAVDAGSG